MDDRFNRRASEGRLMRGSWTYTDVTGRVIVRDGDAVLESVRVAVVSEVLEACDRLDITDAPGRAMIATRAMVAAERGLYGRLTDQQRREHRADAARLLGWARDRRFTLPDDGPGDYEHRRAVAGRYRYIARKHLAVLRDDRRRAR